METTEREALYIEAIGAFFDNAAGVLHRERAIRYESAMAEVNAQNPDDKEGEIFYALAILSNADPTDKTYAVQKRTGAMLEPLFVDMPNHPGLAHYIIHSYDYPSLAERAVEAAHRYLDIARSMPHALHMSGHIFTQLGMWDDSIGANIRSAEAARARGERFGMAQAQMNEIHALDYLSLCLLAEGTGRRRGANRRGYRLDKRYELALRCRELQRRRRPGAICDGEARLGSGCVARAARCCRPGGWGRLG